VSVVSRSQSKAAGAAPLDDWRLRRGQPPDSLPQLFGSINSSLHANQSCFATLASPILILRNSLVLSPACREKDRICRQPRDLDRGVILGSIIKSWNPASSGIGPPQEMSRKRIRWTLRETTHNKRFSETSYCAIYVQSSLVRLGPRDRCWPTNLAISELKFPDSTLRDPPHG